MLSPGLNNFINITAEEIRKEDPEATAHVSDFELKSLILGKIREHAEEEADALIAIHCLTAITKSLRELAPYIR